MQNKLTVWVSCAWRRNYSANRCAKSTASIRTNIANQIVQGNRSFRVDEVSNGSFLDVGCARPSQDLLDGNRAEQDGR